MKQNNNIIIQVNNKLTKMNNSVRKTVQKDIVMNTLRVLLIIYTSFVVPQLKQKQLDVTKNQLVRFIIIAVIVYLSFIDVVSAILLAIALLVTIHRAGSDASNNNNNNNNNRNNRINNVAPAESNVVKNNVPAQSLEEVVAEVVAEPEVVAAINTEQQEPNENGVNGANANVNGVNAHNNANVNGVNNNVNGVNANVNGVNANAHVNATNAHVNAANVNGVNDPSMELFVDAPATTNNINLGVTNLGNNVPVANDNSSVSNLSVFDAGNNAPKNNIINNASNNNALIDQLNGEQPASETLTDNILRAQVSNNNSNDPVGLTTGDDLHAVQENAVPGGDLLHEVKTFQEQHSAQSLGKPMGLGAKRYQGHHHQNEKHPNLKHAMLRNENL